MFLIKEAIAWVKNGPGSHEVVQVVPDKIQEGRVLCYHLYTAYEPKPAHLGKYYLMLMAFGSMTVMY